MKAAQISEYGDASVVKIVDIEKPVIKDGQVLVKVKASSLNPFDTSIRKGFMKDALKLPLTLGGDIAGEVVEVAADVTNFKVGDKVYGQANAVAGNSGAFAEFAATSASQVAIAPSNLDFQNAASLPLVGGSAIQALVEHIGLKSGQKIFINGGAGGIGTMAIQIAKSLGAHVATTASSENADQLKKLGADEVIDYKTQDYTQILKDYDAVYDTVGGDGFAKTYDILKKGGVAVSMLGGVDEAKAEKLGIKAIAQMSRITTEKLDHLRDLVESGSVVTQVNKEFPLDQIVQAFEYREAGGFIGKVVIQIA